jgi:hypothetical protein
MKRWLVKVKVTTEEVRGVEAETSEQAIEKAMQGDVQGSPRTRVTSEEYVGHSTVPDAKWSRVEVDPQDPIP